MDFVQKYIEYLTIERCFKPNSLKEYVAMINAINSEIDPLKASDYSEVKNAIISIGKKRNWSQRSTSKCATVVKNYFAWLTREKHITFNPFPFHEFKRGRIPEPKFITEEVFEKILSSPQLTHQEYTALLVFWDTGIRVGEIAELDQQDYDLNKMVVCVPKEKSKGEYRTRYIPFSERLKAALIRQISFIRQHCDGKAVFVNSHWKRADTRLFDEMLGHIGLHKLPGQSMRLHPHMIRHSCAIRWLEKSVPQIIVQKWLGHSKSEMTSHYLNMTKENSRNIYDMYLTDPKSLVMLS